MGGGGELNPGDRDVEIICGPAAWNASLRSEVILADRGSLYRSSWWSNRRKIGSEDHGGMEAWSCCRLAINQITKYNIIHRGGQRHMAKIKVWLGQLLSCYSAQHHSVRSELGRSIPDPQQSHSLGQGPGWSRLAPLHTMPANQGAEEITSKQAILADGRWKSKHLVILEKDTTRSRGAGSGVNKQGH
jgi:hypothetical protein